jgi:uncharacterized membrane protein
MVKIRPFWLAATLIGTILASIILGLSAQRPGRAVFTAIQEDDARQIIINTQRIDDIIARLAVIEASLKNDSTQDTRIAVVTTEIEMISENQKHLLNLIYGLYVFIGSQAISVLVGVLRWYFDRAKIRT